jgi:cytoskeleton protein RodZ
MPDIGASLREARMRARIDVSDIEAATKIRAKYLRALENEEWDLLPGPTYVKSFLRTYAEALDLDAKLLVDEYKLRHEHLSDVEMQPIQAAAPGRERRRGAPVVPPWVFIALVFGALFASLYALGSCGDDPPPTQTSPPGPATTSPAAPPSAVAPKPALPKTASLRIEATGPVYVCLRAGDRTLVDGQTLAIGERTPTFRSKRFRMTLGNNAVVLRINGRPKTVAPSPDPIGLEITPRRGRQPLAAGKRPRCQ